MTKTVLITGFPGFIATRLFFEIREQDPDTFLKLLVHPSQATKATAVLPPQDEKASLLIGDITQDRLGLAEQEMEELRQQVTHVFHLAAIYDLAVPRDMAYQVNVVGTRNVNQAVMSFNKLEKYVYFSTAYVSGAREGRILEGELECAGPFKNYYEETKCLAEQSVAELGNVPTAIIRPGIIVGDSHSGETIKFDGPYFIMRFLDRFRWAPIPFIGSGKAQINIVPVDYIIAAVIYLSKTDQANGRTFHLCDPSPYAARDAYRMICEQLLDKKPVWTISWKLVDFLLSIKLLRRWLRVERETLDYFNCLAEYDCSNAVRILNEGGIACPNLQTYLPHVIAYYKEHRSDRDKMIQVK